MSKTVTCIDIYGRTYEVSVSKLRWRPSVYGILIKNNAILLLKQLGGYDLPGGGMEFGEIPEEALVREYKEETGLKVRPKEILGVASNGFKTPIENSFVQTVMLYYLCEFVGGELSTDGFDDYEKKNAEIAEWVPMNRLNNIKVTNSIDWRGYINKSTMQEGE